jgi:uncharacterized protein YndB with AHSA1/START domain
MTLAFGEVSGTPDQGFRALTTNEVEQWWKYPGVYHLKDWKADLHVRRRWSVTVELNDGKQVHEWGEFCELDVPNKIVMTRRFRGHPLLAERETTLTYRLKPSPHGTLVTVKAQQIRCQIAHTDRTRVPHKTFTHSIQIFHEDCISNSLLMIVSIDHTI